MNQSNKLRGWIYVISNKAMPGLIKVGYSTKDPKLRAEELNHTGSPHPYKVEYEMLIEEPFQIEQKIHKALQQNHEGKEWFRCSINEAVTAIKRLAASSIIYENLKTDDLSSFRSTVFCECSNCHTVNKIFKEMVNTQEFHCINCNHVLKL
jgi:hypothetical protein